MSDDTNRKEEMMDGYTPTTAEVEDHWADVGFAGDRASFRRWLAEVKAQAVADARGDAGGGIAERPHPKRNSNLAMRFPRTPTAEEAPDE